MIRGWSWCEWRITTSDEFCRSRTGLAMRIWQGLGAHLFQLMIHIIYVILFLWVVCTYINRISVMAWIIAGCNELTEACMQAK